MLVVGCSVLKVWPLQLCRGVYWMGRYGPSAARQWREQRRVLEEHQLLAAQEEQLLILEAEKKVQSPAFLYYFIAVFC